MTGKQGIEKQRGKLKHKLGRDTIFLSAAAVEWAVQCCIRLLLSAVLAGAVVLEGAAPFGVAMTAASGAGLLGGGAVLGACLGSLCQLELTTGLRYASAAMLTYAAAFAFYDVKFLRKAWTMPCVAGITMIFTGLVAHSRVRWTGEEQLWFLMETALTVGAVWCFRAALRTPGILPRREGMSREQRGGLLVLLACIFMALEPLTLLDVSLGRCLGGLFVLWAAWLGGSATGAVWGAVLGAGLPQSHVQQRFQQGAEGVVVKGVFFLCLAVGQSQQRLHRL